MTDLERPNDLEQPTIEKKFFRTVMKVDILSENEPVGGDLVLTEIRHSIAEVLLSQIGGCLSEINLESELELTPQQMAKLLISQGSEPELMGLDSEGNLIEESL